jgi:acyl carrier protein
MENLLTTVQGAFKAAFDFQPEFITIDTKPSDIPGWDSMGHVALVSSLEQAFGLSFDVDEVMEMEDVRQIVRIVKAHLAIESLK